MACHGKLKLVHHGMQHRAGGRELLFVFKMLLPVGSLFMHVHAHGTFSVLYPHPPSRSGSIGSILPEPSLPRNLRFFLSQFQASNGESRSFFPDPQPIRPRQNFPFGLASKRETFAALGLFPSQPRYGEVSPFDLPRMGSHPPLPLAREVSPLPCPCSGRHPPPLPARGGIPPFAPAPGGHPPAPLPDTPKRT